MDISSEKELFGLLFSPEYLPDIKSVLRKHFKSRNGLVEDPASLEWLLSITSWTGWQYFVSALKGPIPLSKKDISLGEYQVLTETGIAQLTKTDMFGKTTFNLTIPDKIKRLLGEFDYESLKRYKSRMSLIHLYVTAAVNAYGVIDIDSFVSMFNGYMESSALSIEQVFGDVREQLNTEELLSVMGAYSKARINAFLIGDRIIHRMISVSDITQFTERVRYNKYHSFAKDRFLRYADEKYYEKTPQVKAFKDLLVEKCKGIDRYQLDVILLVFAPCYMIQWQEIIEVGLLSLPEVCAEENREQFAELFIRAKNSLSNWLYKGHSVDELIKTRELREDETEQEISTFLALTEEFHNN